MTQITIEAGRTERHYWKDLWCYRELHAFKPDANAIVPKGMFGELRKVDGKGLKKASLIKWIY